MIVASTIPVAYLAQCFDMQEDGSLIWKTRPLEHFPTRRGWWVFNGQFPGKTAGSPQSDGYISIKLSWNGREYLILAHHIVWALAHGAWPSDQVDHRNGIVSENRLGNLREAAGQAEQSQNRKRRSDNTSGFRGVCQRASGRWEAVISVNKRRYHLGTFDIREGANAAYLAAKQSLHPFQPIPRESRS